MYYENSKFNNNNHNNVKKNITLCKRNMHKNENYNNNKIIK